jgi:hypothetical protein
MKKTIRLTEKQLNDIVKKVIMEQDSEDMDMDVDSAISHAEEMIGGFEPSDSSNKVQHIEELMDAIDEKIYELKKLKFAIKSAHLKGIYKN